MSLRMRRYVKEIAATQSTRAVAVFFWNNANEVGTQSATVGLELIDGEVIDVFLDQR